MLLVTGDLKWFRPLQKMHEVDQMEGSQFEALEIEMLLCSHESIQELRCPNQ